MKRTAALMTISISLFGCATVQDVQRAHSGELCYRVATGNTAGLSPSVFWQELSNRGENCQQYQAMIQSRMQADRAQAQQGIQLLQAAQPKFTPAPVNQSVTCQTVNVGGGVIRTICN